MAMATYRAGNQATFHDSASAASLTVTLPTPTSGEAWVIDNISIYALGTATVFKLDIYMNDGTTLIWRQGGDPATGNGLTVFTAHGPICTAVADGPKVLLTATGCTAVAVNVNAHLVNV